MRKCSFICHLQDPNADTEWNDVLRAKGILPPKETLEVTEQDLINMVEAAIEQKSRGIFLYYATRFIYSILLIAMVLSSLQN